MNSTTNTPTVWIVRWYNRDEGGGVHAVFSNPADAEQCAERANESDQYAYHVQCWPVITNPITSSPATEPKPDETDVPF